MLDRIGHHRDAAIVALALCVLLPFGCGTEIPPIDAPPDAGADQQGNGGADSAGFAFSEDRNATVAALPFDESTLLVRTLPGASDVDLNEAYTDAGATLSKKIEPISISALSVETGALTAAAAKLSLNPLIESVHKSYFYDVQEIPDDPEFGRQGHFDVIGVPAAWDTTTGDEDRVIAVLDTGVDPTHPDLVDKLVAGWNVYDDNADSADVLGHGTAVAGSAAASSNNGLGVAGVSWSNPIMPIRISSEDGRASSENIATGVVWAIDHGAKIINVSFAPLGADATVLSAADYARSAGALVFISAGNGGKSLNFRSNDAAVFIGAWDVTGELASFSDTGPFVDLVAPGTRIRTTAMGGVYRRVNGTSFASPIAAGVAALVWSVNPDFRPTTVFEILSDTATDLGDPGRDELYGVGLVQAADAVSLALDIVEERDRRAPTLDFIEPENGKEVSGFLRVSVGAFDSVGVADVVLSIDGEPFATDRVKPYRLMINTRDLASGTHTLSVVATDTSGNVSRSKSVRIQVRGGGNGGSGSGGTTGGSSGGGGGSEGAGLEDSIDPNVVISSPVDGFIVATSVAVRATVSDNDALRSVEWLVDGVRQRFETITGTRQAVEFVWNASRASNGVHRITIRVQDESRNTAAATVSVTKE